MAMVIRCSSEVHWHTFAISRPPENRSTVVIPTAWPILPSGLLRRKERVSEQLQEQWDWRDLSLVMPIGSRDSKFDAIRAKCT